MASIKHPGVFIQEIRKFPPSVAEVETAIPAFIGYTEMARDQDGRNLHYKPKRITSEAEYVQFFGSAPVETDIKVRIDESQDADGNTIGLEVNGSNDSPSPHVMFYAIQFFFANGGGPCYIVSVGDYTGTVDAGGSVTDPGLWKGLDTLRKIDEVTLINFPESQAVTTANFKNIYDQALLQCEELKDRFVVMDLPTDDSAATTILDEAQTFRSEGIGSNNLKYGAVYSPNVETIFDYVFDDPDADDNGKGVKIDHFINFDETNTGTHHGKTLHEIDIVDANDNKVNDEIVNRIRQAIGDTPCVLPPASGVLGVYASVDESRGVWKAPANVSLNAVVRPVIDITDRDQDDLNIDSTGGKSINAIRSFTGRGVLVWGARTLAGNDNEWRYVNVRRFFNMAEESIKKATEQFVFEPNDRNTWTRVRGMIENFLLVQWRNGALAGAVPEDAFFVRVGLPETMTSLDILEGRMNVEIGMAVVRPAEFIILKFSHKMQVS